MTAKDHHKVWIRRIGQVFAWPRFLIFWMFPEFRIYWMKHISPKFHPERCPRPVQIPNNGLMGSPWATHVIVMTHEMSRTGAPLLALHIAGEFFRMGLNVHTVSLNDGPLRNDFALCGTVTFVPDEEALGGFLNAMESNGVRVSVAYLNTAVSGRFAGFFKRHGLRVVMLVHELSYAIKTLGLTQDISSFCESSDLIVIPSTLLIDDWRKSGFSFPLERTVVMPQPDYHPGLAVPTADESSACRRRLREMLGLTEDTKVVMGCGTVEFRKGCDVFFDVAEKLLKGRSGVHFVWIGGVGDPREWEKIETRVRKLGPGVSLLGYQDLTPYYQGADVFFLSSREDPFPTAALMAAKCGLPVVYCRAATGVRDIFGEIDQIVAEGDYSGDVFFELISRLLEDGDRCRAAGASCRLAYQEKMPGFRDYALALLARCGQMKMPKISCVIPNYNYRDYLERRVKSIADQTYPIEELIILDDNSTDGSDAEIRRLVGVYGNRFPGGIRYVRNTENAGVFRQWRRGAEMAKGDLIWIAEADDLCSPFLQSRLVHAFIAYADMRIAYAQSMTIDGDDNFTGHCWKTHTDVVSTTRWNEPFVHMADFEIKNSLAIRNTVPNASGALFSKAAVLALPDELLTYRSAGDWFAYLNMMETGRMAFTPEPLNYYRRHGSSVIAKPENRQRLADEIYRIHRWVLTKYDLPRTIIDKMREDYLLNCSVLLVQPESTDVYA